MPVAGEVGGRAVEFGVLREGSLEEALGLGGAEGVADEEDVVFSAVKGAVAGGVAGRAEDGPAGHPGDFGAVAREGLEARAEIDWACGKSGGHQAHAAAAGFPVGCGIGLFAGEVGEFGGVGLDGDVPLVGELARFAGVVEVAVGEHDGVGWRVEELASPRADAVSGERTAEARRR